MMNRRSDMGEVNASVSNVWVKRFVGHRIWSRPESKSGAIAEFVELLGMWEEITEDPGFPYRFHAWIWWKGKAWSALLPKQVYVEGISEVECTKQVFDREGEKVPWFTWTPPFDDPPELERHPKGWEPPQPSQAPAPLSTIVPTEFGDQFALPI